MEKTASLKETLLEIKKDIFLVQANGQLSVTSSEAAIPSDGSTADDPSGVKAFAPAIPLENLGDSTFKNRHGLKYPYVAGAMANGITSAQMVKTMSTNGMLGILGAGGLSLDKIHENIITLKDALGEQPFGFNLIHSLNDPAHEMATVELYLEHQITLISAAAFMRITPALVYYRIKGIYQDEAGEIITPNRVIGKVSRVEIARQFFSPPPEKLVQALLNEGRISKEEARLSQYIPMAQDLTAEADSGGHTDNRPALTLLPTMIALKNEFMATYNYQSPLCVGLAGGIATPESAAAAFSMGAAFILTGSINQACIESGICQDVKQMLCQAQQADVAMAPAADMFEIGAKVQVLKRGTMFPIRAEKLYKTYQTYGNFDQVDPILKKEIEDKFLMASFEQAWASTKEFFQSIGNTKEIDKARENPKHKMALVFRSYLGQSSKWAINGIPERKMDYQIWCGPAIGAFNQWVKDSFLEPAENRKTALIALNLLVGASVCMRASFLRAQGIQLPSETMVFSPLTKEELSTYL